MVAAIRAGISVLMLAGFYVVGLLQFAAACAAVYGLSKFVAGLVAVKIMWPVFAAVVGGTAVATWRAIRHKPDPPRGLPVTPEDAPELWQAVRELADRVGTRSPDEIRLIPDANAWVNERSRLLGLIGGRRLMAIGLPLIQVLSVDQLRAVLAHELGHYSHRHTRLGGVAYRGRVAITETLHRIGPNNLAGWIFKKYGDLYVIVDNAVSRRQEYEADRSAVAIAGRDAAASALRELPVLDDALSFYLDRYVAPGWETGRTPADLFGGFAQFVAARSEELARLREREPERVASKWDTHPPMADRIAAIEAMPATDSGTDDRPAAALLGDAAALGLRLQRAMPEIAEMTALAWDDFTHAMFEAQLQIEADRVFRVIARTTESATVDVGTVLDLAAERRLAVAAEPLFPDATRREVPSKFAAVMEPLLKLAAARSGVARWRHSWTGPPRFTGPDGEPLPLAEIAKLAVTAESVADARRRLTELGIDPASAGLEAPTEDPSGAQIIGGMANMRVERDSGRTEYDLLVTTKGFIFVGKPGRTGRGTRRLRDLVRSAPAAELAQRHWFLPYEEVAATEVHREIPVKATIRLHGGDRFDLKERVASETLDRNCHETLVEVLRRIGED